MAYDDKPQDILSLSDAYSRQQEKGYDGQFSNVQSSLVIGDPPASRTNPFQPAAPVINPNVAAAQRALVRPLNMEAMGKPIKPEQPTGGQGNPYQMEVQQKMSKGG